MVRERNYSVAISAMLSSSFAAVFLGNISQVLRCSFAE